MLFLLWEPVKQSAFSPSPFSFHLCKLSQMHIWILLAQSFPAACAWRETAAHTLYPAELSACSSLSPPLWQTPWPWTAWGGKATLACSHSASLRKSGRHLKAQHSDQETYPIAKKYRGEASDSKSSLHSASFLAQFRTTCLGMIAPILG